MSHDSPPATRELQRELISRFAPGAIRPQDTLQMEPFTHAELSAVYEALRFASSAVECTPQSSAKDDAAGSVSHMAGETLSSTEERIDWQEIDRLDAFGTFGGRIVPYNGVWKIYLSETNCELWSLKTYEEAEAKFSDAVKKSGYSDEENPLKRAPSSIGGNEQLVRTLRAYVDAFASRTEGLSADGWNTVRESIKQAAYILARSASGRREAWRAAIILAHNLCAQYSDRHNANDETTEADAVGAMCDRIKSYADCTDEEIAEMVAEATPPSTKASAK